MTLDVIIGGTFNTGDARYLEPCPPLGDRDICDPRHTSRPREAYRSANNIWHSRFWTGRMRHLLRAFGIEGDDLGRDILTIPLKQHANRIRKLRTINQMSDLDKDRIIWLQYWTAAAVGLYGNDAKIQFR